MGTLPPQIKYIVGNEACERFSYYGMLSILTLYLSNHMRMGGERATEIVHLFATAVYFLPLIGGWLADRFLGRYYTILGLSLFYCLGHGALALFEGELWGIFLGLGLIAIGAGGIKPCVSAFVGDQFSENDHEKLRKVYGLFYWSINLGAFFGFLLIPWFRDFAGYSWAFALPGGFMALATVIFWIGTSEYVIRPPSRVAAAESPAGGVWPVLRGIIVVFLPVPIFWALFNQVNTTWVLQGTRMTPFSLLGFKIDAERMQSAGALLVLIWVPILTLVIYPLVERLGVRATPLRRMGVGMFLAAASFFVCGALQNRIDAGQTLSLAWQILPYVILEAGEVMLSATALEFAFSQAPRTMKSTIMSIWLMTIAGGHFLVAAITGLNSRVFNASGASEFFFYAVLMLVVAAIFVWIASAYRSRDPDVPDTAPALRKGSASSRAGLLGIAVLTIAGSVTAAEVGPVPSAVRERFKLAPFYQKHVDVEGLPIVGSTNVSSYALLEAEWIVRQMLRNRADILRAMASNNVRLAVMAWNEFTTDIPEHSDLKSAVYWDRRARGLGATRARPAVSCAEENLLCYANDPYSTENILVHEFAHAIHEMGLSVLDPSFDKRLRAAFERSKELGLWKGTYAASNRSEYWAEGVQSWFDNNREKDALHNHVNTRAELKEYDPELAKLCAEVFGDNDWRYVKPMQRAAADRAHLQGHDFKNGPRFRWRARPVPEKPRVLIQTEFGDIELELYATNAPNTVRNFLRYVDEGFYSDGHFHRTVTPDNQPTNKVKIEVIQAAANPARTNELFAAIQLERTRDTNLKHVDGAVSMARFEPDSARDHFFICVGDQPELDFGGRRHPDGQGFAAFGKVTRGMDVVRKIHRSPADGQTLAPALRIQRAIRLE